MIKLNLGAGDERVPGFINVDLYNEKADVKCDIRKLSYDDNSVDEIRAYHVIEHFHYYEAIDVLREWRRVLKVGGPLTVETPDFLGSCKVFVNMPEGNRRFMYGHFFSTPWINDGMVHKFLFTPAQLTEALNAAGFETVKRCEPDSKAYFEWKIKEMFLNMKAIKTGP
jgi:predicted SAM-dependent methyltransferase